MIFFSGPPACRLPALFVAALGLGLAGCQSSLNQKHTFIAQDSGTKDLSLVRVQIDGYAEMADVTYKAGYRDSKAIDEVVKGAASTIAIDTRQTDDRELIAAANEITVGLLAALKNAYAATPRNPEQIAQLERDLSRAQSLPRIVRAGETSLVSEAPAEKFVIAYSAKPSQVFEQIARVTSRNEGEGKIYASLYEFSEAQQRRLSLQTTTSQTLWKELLQPSSETLKDIAIGDDESTGNEEKLRTRLNLYRQKLSDYLHAEP